MKGRLCCTYSAGYASMAAEACSQSIECGEVMWRRCGADSDRLVAAENDGATCSRHALWSEQEWRARGVCPCRDS